MNKTEVLCAWGTRPSSPDSKDWALWKAVRGMWDSPQGIHHLQLAGPPPHLLAPAEGR